MQYDWPGNIRELHNVIESSIVLSNTPIIHELLLPEHIHQYQNVKKEKINHIQYPNQRTLYEIEKNTIFEALNKTNGNKSEAANLLQISRRTLYREIRTILS